MAKVHWLAVASVDSVQLESLPVSVPSSLPGLLTPSFAYKPFRYPWAYEFWKKQQQVHWMPEEVPLGEDLKDWATKLNDKERNLLTQIFRFFTQSDVEVNDNYMERYIARTLAMFGGFTEGLQLFASFAMLMNFPRHNKMKGMGQIVSWSVRDESLHCEGIIKLYHAFNKETGCVTKSVADDIIDCCKTVVTMEDAFIDLAFDAGEVQGMTPEDIKNYIRFIADWRLRQLGLPEVYGSVKENPLPWLQSMLSGVEHANFFEARSTEYSKAATKGQWQGAGGVWGEFDKLLAKRTEPAE
jgi:ribonucleotide reductase beta subunit family protein with ferritin-like domain